MLNRVILMGRITHDLEMKQTPSGAVVVPFSLAVERNFKEQNGERQTDFISCVAWGKTAEHIGRYFAKGRMIAVEGQLRTRTYDDKNGSRHYITEVVVSGVSFTGEPKPQDQQRGYGNYQNNGYQNSQYQNNGYQNGNYQQNNSYSNNAPGQNYGNAQNTQLSLDDDFEVLSDDGVQF